MDPKESETCQSFNCLLKYWYMYILTYLSFDYTLITNLMHWLFIHKILFSTHISSIKYSSSGRHSCIHAAYGTVTLYKSSWWPVDTQLEWELTAWQSVLTLAAYRQATRNSYREWQYHMLHVYNYVLLKMSTWCSKHVSRILFYE